MSNFTKLSLPYFIGIIICFIYIIFAPLHWFFTSVFAFLAVGCIYLIQLLWRVINLRNSLYKKTFRIVKL